MPTVADQVSREHTMLRAAADKGFVDGDKAMVEASSPLSARAQTRSSPILRRARRKNGRRWCEATGPGKADRKALSGHSG